ncbi:MAG TPA: Lpg1974 family pore-forming outer membrane protein [Candidatus Polarisedimenticolia bacterium]|nr:Lpg1974 family pore-forming outer membrane protein [Candidatus Polarisedimenticolia bacterium]
MRHAWLCLSLFFLFTGASHAEDARGWLLALDLALAQPTGVDQPLALVSAPRSERISLEHDADLAWGAGLGYAFGPNHGRIQVSYWTFENDDAENFTQTGTVYPQLFGYGYYGSFYLCNQSSGGCDSTLPVSFAGTFNIKASTWDLDYADTLEITEHFGLKWLAGLRTASYEQEQSFEGFDGYYTYLQDKSLDVDAIGIRVGAAGDFHLSQHFSLRAGMAYSSLIGTSEGKASQRIVELGLSESRSGKDDNFSGSILDLELRGVWSAGPVDISLGLTNSQWNGFPRDQVPAVGFQGVGESSVDDSLSFSSFEVGLLWRFGRQRFTSP